MTADEQEALSRKYSNDVVIILPLKSTRWAVFDSLRRLCAVVEAGEVQKAVMEVVARQLADIPMPGTKEWFNGPPLLTKVEGKTTFRDLPIKIEVKYDEIDLEELDL